VRTFELTDNWGLGLKCGGVCVLPNNVVQGQQPAGHAGLAFVSSNRFDDLLGGVLGSLHAQQLGEAQPRPLHLPRAHDERVHRGQVHVRLARVLTQLGAQRLHQT
jgi:hypothetical protein